MGTMKLTVNGEGSRMCFGGCDFERATGFHPELHLIGPDGNEQAVFKGVLPNETIDTVGTALAVAHGLSWTSVSN